VGAVLEAVQSNVFDDAVCQLTDLGGFITTVELKSTANTAFEARF